MLQAVLVPHFTFRLSRTQADRLLMYDVRAIANRVLERAWSQNLQISNLELNKIVYFVVVEALRQEDRIITKAKIEAWKYGPVFRELYGQFKRFGAGPITERAKRIDFESGLHVEVDGTFDSEIAQFIDNVSSLYVGLPAGLLVDLSHAKGGAWDKVWNHDDELNIGMEITVEHIRAYELKSGPTIRKN